MKLKNFQDLVEECLTKEEIAEIEQQAQAEFKALQEMQESLKDKLHKRLLKKEILNNPMKGVK